MSPASTGRFLSTAPPRKYPRGFLNVITRVLIPGRQRRLVIRSWREGDVSGLRGRYWNDVATNQGVLPVSGKGIGRNTLLWNLQRECSPDTFWPLEL